MEDKPVLTHVDASGEARMVDVGGKTPTLRAARAGAKVWMAVETMRLLKEQALPKGDVLAVARVAGIMAAKRTPELVPLCHPLSLTHVDISFDVRETSRGSTSSARRGPKIAPAWRWKRSPGRRWPR